jgi:hypothetical protein
MRTRETIEKDVEQSRIDAICRVTLSDESIAGTTTGISLSGILEVLLDIRDLLSPRETTRG